MLQQLRPYLNYVSTFLSIFDQLSTLVSMFTIVNLRYLIIFKRNHFPTKDQHIPYMYFDRTLHFSSEN